MVATLLCAGLAAYDIFRDPIIAAAAVPVSRVLPSWVMWPPLAAILFIIQILTISGEADRRLIASYPTHFDIAWKQGVHFGLALCFVLLWGQLYPGAELFRLIRIEFLAFLKRKTNDPMNTRRSLRLRGTGAEYRPITASPVRAELQR